MTDTTATEILDTLMKNLKELVTTKSVVGEPIQAGNATILPIMKVSLGFGAGGGTAAEKTNSRGGGGGGGASISPVGFLVVEDGKAMMVTPGTSKWDWIAESIPDLWEKLAKVRDDARARRQARSESGDPGEATSDE